MTPPPDRTGALLAQMPRWFVEQARAVEKKARRRREAQRERFERAFTCAVDSSAAARSEWQDTVMEILERGR